MSNKKFVIIIASAMFAFVFVVASVAFATAEESTYKVDAVVVSWETTPLGDVFVEAVDEDGDLMAWYEDSIPHIGDIFTLTVFDYGDKEEAEIIDACCVERLSVLELVQWLIH